MTVQSEVDEVLVKRVQKGDKKAFDLLVLKYQNRILMLVNRYVRDMDESLDVAQEVFVKAYRSLSGFRGDSAFFTWLYRIAINTAKNHLTSQGRRPPSFDVELDGDASSDLMPGLREHHTPEHEMVNEEIVSAVVAAVESLPEDLKAAITLREMEGLSYEQIAEVMDCPIGTVRSRIFRAREAIDRALHPVLGREQAL